MEQGARAMRTHRQEIPRGAARAAKCHGGCPSWGVAECSCPCERATPRACGHQAGGVGVQSGHQAGGGGVQRGPTPVARAEPVGGAILRAGGLGVPRVSALWVRIMPCSGVRRPVARAEFCGSFGIVDAGAICAHPQSSRQLAVRSS